MVAVGVPRCLLPLAVVATGALIGCGGSSSAAVIPATSGAGSGQSSPAAAPVAIDPCALMTQQEAATMMGVAVGGGRLTSGECIFSGYSPEASVTIQVARVLSQGEARAALDSSVARIPSTWTVTQLPSVDDGAAIARISSGGTALSVIFVVDASVFFSVICEEPACTDAALKTGASIIGRRLPLGTNQETRALRAAHPASEAGQFVAPDVPVGSEAEPVRTAP